MTLPKDMTDEIAIRAMQVSNMDTVSEMYIVEKLKRLTALEQKVRKAVDAHYHTPSTYSPTAIDEAMEELAALLNTELQ